MRNKESGEIGGDKPNGELSSGRAERIREKVLDWYHENRRSMPWREDPTPYHVWVSEIMLQQTRVEAVREYYRRFMERLPDVESLATVDEEELHKLWQGLGYYNRAKNLQKAAKRVMEEYGGEIPSTYERLLQLPGVGAYTAGAIASIAFREPVPAVDGNVMRIVSRVTGDGRDITTNATAKAMADVVKEWIPVGEVHHFNQALMEIGALVCLPNGKPKCEACPLGEFCFARREGRQAEFPVKKPKKERKKEQKTVLLLQKESGEYLLRKRGEKGLLSGLWEFPLLDGALSEDDVRTLLAEGEIVVLSAERLENARHIFTHIEWEMVGYHALVSNAGCPLPSFLRGKEGSPLLWASAEEIDRKYSIPSAFRVHCEAMRSKSRRK